MAPLFHPHILAFAGLLCLCLPLSANTLTVSGAVNSTDASDQGSASSGTLTCTTLVVDNSSGDAPGQLQQFTVSGLDLNGIGGNNDSAVISFRVTGHDNIQTSGTAAVGWLSAGGVAINADGEWITVTYADISVNIDGGTGNGFGSFAGFTGAFMGNWGDADDVATVNGEQFTPSGPGNARLSLADTSQDSLRLTYTTGNASPDAGEWRHLGSDFIIEVSATLTPPTGPVITSFSADDRSVDAGQTVNLSWQTADATTLSIDQGVGDVTSLTSNGGGSTPVTINAATTFTLTATNAEGSTTATLPIHLRPDKPNVLVILIDDWGTEDCSVNFNLDANDAPIPQIDPTTVGLPSFSQSNTHFDTPTLETLAAQGTIFTRAYVSPVCSPTRVTFMTGQNTARHRTTNYIGGGGSRFNIKSQPNRELTAANRTIAEVMRDGGYRTIITGKGHVGGDNLDINNYKTPAANPADDFYGFQINVAATGKGQHRDCYSNGSPAFNINGSSVSENEFVAEYQDETYNDIDPVKYAGETWKDEPLYVTEALTLEMIERIEDSVALGQPFFAYFSHYATHQPHGLDPRFQNNPKYAGLSGTVLNLATMVEGVDHSTADVMAKLEELGVAEDTIIIFFGDNGTEADPGPGNNPDTLGMSNPLRGQKGHRHEGGSRVPFIVSWVKPDATNSHQQAFPIIAGQKQHDLIAGQDLYPTICAAAGLTIPTTDDNGAPLVIDGHNLAGYLAGTPGTHRPQKLLIHFPTPHAHDFYSILHEDEWKLIYNYNSTVASNNVEAPLGSYELFKLDVDPYEADNRADPLGPNYAPDRVMSMARELVAEIANRNGEYPYLLGSDSALAGINLPSDAGDLHPVILPAMPNVDLDGDDLADNTEDPNRNGTVDSGETDPDNENTDGDNINDGDEAKIGTDPLDINSYFRLESTFDPGGSLILSWPSSPGSTFSIFSSTDLDDWTTHVTTGVIASPGTSTSHDLGIPGGTRCFYKIGLE